MNKTPQITLSNPQLAKQPDITNVSTHAQLPAHALTAKNIQFFKGTVTMDVFMDKHWQTIRLGITSHPETEKIPSANIQLSQDGKTLVISAHNTKLSISNSSELQRFLNFLTSGNDVKNTPITAHVILTPAAKLVIEKLNVNIAINKQIANMLITEGPIKVMFIAHNKGAQLHVVNQFFNTVYSQTLNQEKLTNFLAANLPQGKLHATAQLAILSPQSKTGAIHIPLNKQQLASLPRTPTDVNLNSQAGKLHIKTLNKNLTIGLNNSFSKTFNKIQFSHHNASTTESISQTRSMINIESPIKSWLKTSLSDLKTRVIDAVKYFENKPFAVHTTTSAHPPSVWSSSSKLTPLSQKLNITHAVNEQYNSLPPLLRLTQQLKSSINAWQITTPRSTAYKINYNEINNLIEMKNSANINLYPLEKKLLSPLLAQHNLTSKQKTINNNTLVTNQINHFIGKVANEPPELNRLVNQAFSRMLSASNLSPSIIQREIMSTLTPTQLPFTSLQSSFNKGLEHVALSILATPIINQAPNAVSFNNLSGVEALLHILLPSFKMGNTSKKLIEQLQQPHAQTLANELVQIKNSVSQVLVSPVTQQSDTHPLVQFLLPMKLPTEAAQTEITLGQYEKSANDKCSAKKVWFIRLNFDYAELGALQISAELMDKTLNCQLIASSEKITRLAQSHLENLKSKLAKHGLKIAKMSIEQGDPNLKTSRHTHAIISIKV